MKKWAFQQRRLCGLNEEDEESDFYLCWYCEEEELFWVEVESGSL